MATFQPVPEKLLENLSLSSGAVVVVQPEDDVFAIRLANKLIKFNLACKPQSFAPRGLINTGNRCYINAILQGLLVCPPFFKLIKRLPLISGATEERTRTSTPILDSFSQLGYEFKVYPRKKKSLYEQEEFIPFQPSCVYEMLTIIKSPLSENGRQEDAEEFLSSMLNGINEEIMALLQHYNENLVMLESLKESTQKEKSSPARANEAGHSRNEASGSFSHGAERELNRTPLNYSRNVSQVDILKTATSKIFQGKLCTTLYTPYAEPSVSYEPFFSLPLEVPYRWYSTIEDALYGFTQYQAVQTSVGTYATRQQTFEVLPPVLILHLKRFIHKRKGGAEKILNEMGYKNDFVIGQHLLSKTSNHHSLADRSYKLCAVIYHHGEKITCGHYTADVYHVGLSSWLRIDDSNVSKIPSHEVTAHNPNRTAYILFYRRSQLV